MDKNLYEKTSIDKFVIIIVEINVSLLKSNICLLQVKTEIN